MAELSYPFETQDTTETQYSYLFDALQDTGVVGRLDSASTLYVALPGTGMTATLSAGMALVRGFAYQNTSDLTITLDAANTQPRIDLIILRLDPAANSIVAAVKKGTPGASPSAPALTQTPDGVYEYALGQITIPANATAVGPADFVDLRRAVGRGVGAWRTPGRPNAAWTGQMGYNLQTQKFEWFTTGNAWSSAFPMDLDASALADNSVTNAKLVTKPGNYVSVRTETTSISLSSADVGRLIVYTGSAGVTVTLFGAGFTAGQRIDFIQDGAGQITFQAGASNTLAAVDNKFKTNKQYSGATLVYLGSNAWRLIGDLAA